MLFAANEDCTRCATKASQAQETDTDRSNEIFLGEHLLPQLKAMRKTSEPGVVFEINMLEVELLQQRGELWAAFERTNALLDDGSASASGSGEW